MINIINFLRYLKNSKFGNILIEVLIFLGIYEIINNLVQNLHDIKRKKIRSSEHDLSPFARKIYTDIIKSVDEYKNNAIAITIPSTSINITEEIVRLSKLQLLEMAKRISANTRIDRKPKIFVDISGIVAQNAKYISGVQRVTISIVKEFFLNTQNKFDIVPVYSAFYESGYREANNLVKNFFNINIKASSDEIIDPRLGDIFLGLDLARKETIDKAEYLKQMHNCGVKIYFLVYDLLPIKFPNFWPAILKNNEMHSKWLQIICQFDGAICISKSVFNEFKAWYKKNIIKRASTFKIEWFHIGADISSNINSVGLSNNYFQIINALKAKHTFLSVGTLEPRKGNEQILSAFEILWQKKYDFNLVFVGKKGWLVNDLIKKINKHFELNKRLFWINNASDEYLEKIYNASTCLIAASYGEGFGLPLIEAARHKIPLIVRDIPVFREVAKNNAFYFIAKNEQELANQIIKWFELYQNNQTPTSENMHFLTWKKSVVRLFEIIATTSSI